MTFEELRTRAQAASASGTMELDAAAIAAELAGPFLELLRAPRLELEGVRVPRIDDREIRVSGTYRLPKVGRRVPAIAVEASFHPVRNGVGYTLVFTPTDHWLDAISGELAQLVELLPVELDALWFTLSSARLEHARIEIPGREIADTAISAGRGYLFRFRSRLLDLLALEETVFSLLERADPLRFSTSLQVSARIPPVLDLAVERVAFDSAGSLQIHGRGRLALFGAELTCEGDLVMGASGFSFALPVQDFVAPFDGAFFRSLSLKETVATFGGTLSAYTVGMAGKFAVAGSGNGGRYEFKYASGNSSGVPDLFQLTADRLTLSDAFTVMAGVPVRLPGYLDEIVVLERPYLYYATRDGLTTLSGVPSRRGARVHSNVRLLGHAAYGEVEATGEHFRAKLLLSPIRLGGIIEISGSGERPPRGWSGTRVEPDAIHLEVDSARKTGMASIEVKLLDQVSGGIVATLAERSLDFRVPLRLPEPIGKLEFAAKLGELDLSLETELDLTLSVEIDAGSVQFELVKDVEMTVAVRVEAGRTDASATAQVSGKVGPLRLPSFTLTLDPRDLERLPSLILDRVTREVERLFADAERWLQAVLDGTIRSITSVAVVLREHFRKTEREAAKLLKKAGYTVERAAEALDVALDQMLNVLVGPDAFTEQELVDAFGRMVGHTNPAWLAREVGDLLLHNGMDPDRVVEHVGRVLSEPKKVAEVLSFLDYPADEIADFLRRNGVGIRETGLLVAGFFPFFRTEEELSDALRFGGYVAAEAASVATNIVRESWRGVENVRDEVERAWRRYMPRFKW